MEKVLMLLASEYFCNVIFQVSQNKSCVLVHCHTETAPMKRLAFVNPARRHACFYSKHTTRLLKTMCVLSLAGDDFSLVYREHSMPVHAVHCRSPRWLAV